MSIFHPTLGEKQARERQTLAFWSRIRQNFWLKTISLAAAVLLYFFVQQERNPTIPRTITAPIIFDHTHPEVEVESDQQMEVTLTGPRPIIEGLKEGDVRLRADLSAVSGDKVTTERIPLTYDIRLSEEFKRQLTREPDMPSLKIQIYPHRTIERNIEVHFAKDTPVGVHYGRPILHPDKVKITGRADRIARIERVVMEATASEPGAEVEGDAALSPRDRDNNPVTGVTLSIPKAHVRIPLEQEDYSKIVSISPLLSDLPLPTYRLVSVKVEPTQARIVGRPELVNPISTLTTEEISVREVTENETLEANLKPVPGVTIRDLKGNLLTKVKVNISIVKVSAPPAPGPPPAHPETNPSTPTTKPDTHP